MRRFTEELKQNLLDRLQHELDKCWEQFGEDPRYRDLDEAFIRGYSISEGFDYAIDVFRDCRQWTKQDEEFLNKKSSIWENYRKKYFNAKGLIDPLEIRGERERHRI